MNNQEISSKLLEYTEQLKIFSEQAEEYNKIRNRYEALFYEKSAYKQVLQKTHLLSLKEDNTFAFNPIKRTKEDILILSPQSPSKFPLFVYNKGDYYSENDRRNEICIEQTTYASPVKKYRLLLDADGEIFIIVSLENKDCEILNFKNCPFSFLLNLPLMVAVIIKNKDAKKEREKLEKIVKMNPTSTLANIYTYAKAHFNKIFGLGDKINKFKKDLTIYKKYCSEKDVYDIDKYESPNTFPLKSPNIYYSITEKAKEIYVEMSFTARFGFYEIDDESFPFIFLFNKENYKSYFSSHEEFYRKTELWRYGRDRETLFTFNTNDLLTLEGKIKEVADPIEVTSNLDLNVSDISKNPWKNKMFRISKAKTTMKLELEGEELIKLEKVVSEDLEENSKMVLKALEEFILSSNLKPKLAKRNIILKGWEKNIEALEQDAKELVNFLADIYKNEIVLNEI